ncbi:MAG: dTDP-glucose 4,6-dehydratase [Planctomycetota bacterium]
MQYAQPTILVTGGAGFIGSNFVRMLLAETDAYVVNVDLLTYAGHRASLQDVLEHDRHEFIEGDIADAELMAMLFRERQPTAIVHLAAETHVDRSIDGPDAFTRTNVLGTGVLLRTCLEYWEAADASLQAAFRFLHVSTDEVYGSLALDAAPFSEVHPYDPSSPYAASKAGSDHLVRAFHRTYGLPTVITNSSNNYGPYQFPEKLIPLMTLRALARHSLPLYGDGQHVRDWLFVEDQCRALLTALHQGIPGKSYNIGASAERTNQQIVEMICDAVDTRLTERSLGETRQQITYVADRPGHDRRYAIDASQIRSLGWRPQVELNDGIQRTVAWYAEHPEWVAAVSRDFDRERRLGIRDKR